MLEPDILQLAPELAALFELDPDEAVRYHALYALGNLDLAVEASKATSSDSGPAGPYLPRQILSVAFSERLAKRYAAESSERVRLEIIKTLALAEAPAAIRRPVLAAALADPSPDIVSQAARGIGESQHVDALPALVKLLQHPDRNVRMVTAQSIASFGAVARPFLADLERALAAEPEGMMKETIRGTISIVTR